jgi:hypothetical protein
MDEALHWRRSAGVKGLGNAAPRRRKGASEPASLLDAWWASVLAGDVHDPHPIHRDVTVRLHGGRLRLSGELDSGEDRNKLVQQARERIGHGIDHLDVSSLKVVHHKEKAGILEQTLISAFPSREAAEYALDFVLRHSHVVPTHSEIVDVGTAERLRKLLPYDVARDMGGKALDSGHALLILRVDETEAFKVRELLDEDTRSEWTVAMPPRLVEASK